MSGRASFAVHASCVRGVEAVPVTVEIDMSAGLPGISIVGMGDAAVLEARSRVRCAIRSAGFEVPRAHITVNLAPGDMRKQGSGFDLPIAVGILAASAQIPTEGLDGALFVGELALDGTVTSVRGDVAYQMLARDSGLRLEGGPLLEGIVLPGVDRRVLESLADLRAISLEGRCAHRAAAVRNEREVLDFAEVSGQEMAKRALALAACGHHGMLMVGPPGSGKTMLARRLPTILPPIDPDEAQEALLVHSVAGEDVSSLIAGSRPFRSPHHSISIAGMIGGGRPIRPGEVSLAHSGVLFLDELGEFSTNTLQTLRQPMEEGMVNLVRAEGSFRFPARFQFLAASNPCPCGHLGDPGTPCTCSPSQVERYRSKLGGPLADRIDITLVVGRPDPRTIVDGEEGKSSRELADEVRKGMDFASWRRSRYESTGAVTDLMLDEGGEDSLVAISRSRNLTGRGIVRLARVARTIADMEGATSATAAHLLEAASYRSV